MLNRVEDAWQQKDRSGGVIARVKRLRTLILADMVAGKVTPEERERRWYDLAALYYAQQISHYPRNYITAGKNLPEHVIETVERLEEDFVDHSHLYRPFHAVVEVGEAIPVGPERERGCGGRPDHGRDPPAVADDDGRPGGRTDAGVTAIGRGRGFHLDFRGATIVGVRRFARFSTASLPHST